MDIITLKTAVQSLFDSHEQELLELQEKYGASNIDDFYYSEHLGSWILKFKEGEDQEFETKEELIEWIKVDCNED